MMDPLPEQQTPQTKAPTEEKSKSRFRALYEKYRAKGKWFVIGFVAYYLVRDTILYIILPYYLAKNGISLLDLILGD